MSEKLPIEDALSAVGDLLRASNDQASIVVVGGATLILLGFVQRATSDVDVIAHAYRDDAGRIRLEQADTFPRGLEEAIRVVARDFALPPDWMNTEVGRQRLQGLPPSILDDISWRHYGSLEVGLVGRRTLIALKLFAAVDAGPRSVHTQDLSRLAPTDAELEDASAWVATQDSYEGFGALISEVVQYVRHNRP